MGVRFPVADRFWEKVGRRGLGECWPWLAGTYPNGYGKFKLIAGSLEMARTESRGAHRVAFRLVHGYWPVPGALHGCDNVICCNAESPVHVHEGTQAQNLQEMTDRGRRATNPRSPVWDKTDEIYAVYEAGGVTQLRLATVYGVSEKLMRKLLHQAGTEDCRY